MDKSTRPGVKKKGCRNYLCGISKTGEGKTEVDVDKIVTVQNMLTRSQVSPLLKRELNGWMYKTRTK